MTQLISPDDPRYFTLSCHKDYDRHAYKLCLSDGSSMQVDDWETAKSYWFQWAGMGRQTRITHVEVLDLPEKNNNKQKGFK